MSDWTQKLWPFGKSNDKNLDAAAERFELAKEATRRAAFLSLVQGTYDEESKRQLAELFRTCRTAALSAGAELGQSEAQVDGVIAAICDADNARMRSGSDQDIREFARDSGEVIKRFLSTI